MQTQLTSNLCLVVCLVVCACVRSVRARACVYVRERESNLSIRQVLPISAISLYFITSGGIGNPEVLLLIPILAGMRSL